MLIYAPATILPRLSALGIVLVGAHLLPQDQYGYFSLVIVVGEMLEMTCVGWTRIALLRLGGKEHAYNAHTITRFGCFGAVSVVFASALAALIAFVLAPESYVLFSLSVAFYAISNFLNRYGLTLLQAQGRGRQYSVVEIVRSIIYFTVSTALMSSTQRYFEASIAGSLITLLCGVCALFIATKRLGTSQAAQIETRSAIEFGLPILIVSALSYCITSLDKLVIGTLDDKAVVGAYAVAFALGRQGFDVIANAINIGGFPRLINAFKEKGVAEAQEIQTKTLTLILAIAVPAACALIASRAIVAEVLLPASYHQAILVALPLVVVGSVALNVKNFVYDNIFHLYKKNLYQAPTLIGGAIISLSTAWFLLPRDAFLGASAMFAAGSLAALLLSIVVTRKFMRISIDWRKVLLIAAIGAGVYAAEWLFHMSELDRIAKFATMSSVGLLGVVLSLAMTQRSMFGGVR